MVNNGGNMWSWPKWLRARWIAMDMDGVWHGFLGNKPVKEVIGWDWGDPDTIHLRACVMLDPHMFDWVPPFCDNWENSLMENPWLMARG